MVVPIVDLFFPKDCRILLFGSHAGRFVGGNSKALFDYIRSLPDSPFRCYFLTRRAPSGHDPDVLVTEPLSLKTLLVFLMAKTVLVTHGLGDFHWLRFSRRKYYVKLWHGRPGIKGDGYSLRRATREALAKVEKEARLTTAFLVCSKLEAYMRAFSNSLHARQILPLGYPRNDVLLRNSSPSGALRALFDDVEFSTVVLYAPTWRDYSQTRFFPWADFDNSRFQEWLVKNNVLMLLRAHRNDSVPIPESERVRNLSFEICPEVTDVLPEVDILITDYSSIAADFLLLDRPIVYVPYDLDEFEQNVGFCYDDAELWMPGKVVDSFAGFLEALETALSGKDGFEDQRRRVNRLVNSYQHADSSRRVYEYLKKLLGMKKR